MELDLKRQMNQKTEEAEREFLLDFTQITKEYLYRHGDQFVFGTKYFRVAWATYCMLQFLFIFEDKTFQLHRVKYFIFKNLLPFYRANLYEFKESEDSNWTYHMIDGFVCMGLNAFPLLDWYLEQKQKERMGEK